MTVVAKKKLSKKEKAKIFDSALEKIRPIDVVKYKGKFKWNGDPLKLQKEWRDE